jgi:hypothetical protein
LAILAVVSGPEFALVVSVFLACAVEAVEAQGAGASWPGGDAALLAIIPGLALVSLAMVARLRRAPAAAATASEPARAGFSKRP